MPSALSIKLGDFLYKNAFPVYNIIYPFFKRKQDKADISLMNKHIKKGDVVLDIGANIGFYTKILSDLVGTTGKVYAFEPDKTNFSHLKNNAGNLTNVEFINKAVSDKTGKIILYKSELLNVDHKTYETENYTEKIEIDCVAADDVVANKKVDFIKIDIQGFEYFAFQGMQQIFDLNKDLKIITEFYPLGLYNAKINPLDFFELLWKNNFIVYKTENETTTEFVKSDIEKYTSVKDEYTFVDLFIEKKK